MAIRKDLTGQKINHLCLLKRKSKNQKTYYFCKCMLCGKEKWIRSDSIIGGKTKSCGCIQDNTKFSLINIVGNTYGSLTVLQATEKRDRNGCVIWDCLCNCGNTCYVSYINLIKHRVSSCGCKRNKVSHQNIRKAIKVHLVKHIVFNTNLQVIQRKKIMRHNTSGVTGVVWDASKQRWKAVIEFQNKKYFLGRYVDKEKAIEARKEAEKRLHDSFVEWYHVKFIK